MAKGKVRRFDWWRGTEVDGVRFVTTPAQHFSGRGLRDGNRTLWASWVIDGGERRVFFSGDGGYFKGCTGIGRRFGPFEHVPALGDAAGIGIATPVMGERVGIGAPHAGERWWRTVMAQEWAGDEGINWRTCIRNQFSLSALRVPVIGCSFSSRSSPLVFPSAS